MAKTVNKKHILDHLYLIKESHHQINLAIQEGQYDKISAENKAAQDKTLYLVNLIQQAVTIL